VQWSHNYTIYDQFDKKELFLKKIILFFLFCSYVFADVYYAKLEPYESYNIKSDVAGKVVFSDLAKEGKWVKKALVVKIDDKTDKEDLKTSIKKLSDLHNMEKLILQNIKAMEKTYQIKKRNYDRIKNLTTKSNFEKDNQLITVIAANASLINAKQSLINLQNSIKDIEYKIFVLKQTIAKKNIIVKNRYIYKLNVKKGDYVAPGVLILSAMDISRAKAVVYLSYEDRENLDKKIIYINGKKTSLKFDKVWNVADSINISSYRAELYLPKPREFSKVIKIELK